MILAKNIKKKFSKNILNDITFLANNGEIVGVAGENGSGKSTLLSILAGIMLPDVGDIDINGKIGYVPQDTSLFENLSVRDNLQFWASAYNAPLTTGEQLPHKLLNRIDQNLKVKHLSGGMKKRVSIALACLNDPDWLIMDEPTSALDIGFKGMLFQMIEDIRQNGKGVVFTTHQPDELLWCDRIYILRDGVFIYEGSPKNMNDLSDILYGW